MGNPKKKWSQDDLRTTQIPGPEDFADKVSYYSPEANINAYIDLRSQKQSWVLSVKNCQVQVKYK
jgi:hypothetical protein